MSNTFGVFFRVTTFGESHCKGVGAIVDGCPAGMELTEADIQPQLSRRRPGQSHLVTPRQEEDIVTIYSGTEFGRSLGTPIMLLVNNKDQKPGDYGAMNRIPRPSHADFTYQMKYGIRASSGGGRASARETVARVAVGAIAEKWLHQNYGTEIVAWVSAVGDIEAPMPDLKRITRALVDAYAVRCPDANTAESMENLVREVLATKDSVGGVITCLCRNVPIGLGEPVFDKLEALLAQAMLSLPATKAFDIGSGFAGTRMRGSQHNDPFVLKGERLGTRSNYSGGVQGGISNGEDIVFRVGFKPTATIGQIQPTVDFDGNEVVLAAQGRHDPCVVPRAVPIVEAMAALVLIDLALRQQTIQAATNFSA
jgi:chorismate synthase